MNHHYLIQHISRHLHTLVRRYSPDWELLEAFCARADLQDDGLGFLLESWFSSIESLHSSSSRIPAFLCVNKQAVYACILTAENIFVLGPVLFSAPVAILHHETTAAFGTAFVNQIPVCDFSDFMADVLLITNLFRTECIDKNDILQANCINPQFHQDLEFKHTTHTFANHETGKLHNPYDQEIREFTSIEKGDIEGLRNSLSEDYPGEVGKLARTPLRQMKNRGIAVITLASRAAMKGGILPEEAYSLSDVYIQEIENCNDIPAVLHLFHSAEYRYAQMVHDHNAEIQNEKQSNIYTERCKTYIFSHLHETIHVQAIADQLNLNANYVSEIFHKYEGITITEYIHREKIKLAQNLLIYSRYSYSEIAAYLGYSSQSHLGRQFKKYTGMTMGQYRNKYGTKYF